MNLFHALSFIVLTLQYIISSIQAFSPNPTSSTTTTGNVGDIDVVGRTRTRASNNKPAISKIAILTSGGDCPSLNACIRAIYKTAKTQGIKTVYGLPTGIPGLIKDDIFELDDDTFDTTYMLIKGGSKLGGFVSKDFIGFDALSMDEKVSNLVRSVERYGIDGIIATGGDESLDLLSKLLQHANGTIPFFVGIPKTIDNDIPKTIYSLGFDSAVSVISKALISIRDTAESHRRIMVVECMGRRAGFLALHGGLAGGADTILLPEFSIDSDNLLNHIQRVYDKNKCAVIVVGESTRLPQTGETSSYSTADGGFRFGGSAEAVARFISQSLQIDARHVVLGHVQRGASPSSFDQVLATNLGSHAVQTMCNGISDVFVTWNGSSGVDIVPLEDVQDVESKSLTKDYSELVTAQSMGIYCGEI